MAERSNAHDSKSCYAGMYTRVQIPFSAPKWRFFSDFSLKNRYFYIFLLKKLTLNLCFWGTNWVSDLTSPLLAINIHPTNLYKHYQAHLMNAPQIPLKPVPQPLFLYNVYKTLFVNHIESGSEE